MNRLLTFFRPTWQCLALVAGTCALTLALPTIGRSQDPVETLKEALKINIEGDREMQLKQRPEKVANAIKDLRTITQLRRAYFLKEWPLTRPEIPDPATDIEKYRKAIGQTVLERIRKSALEGDRDRQIAALMLIAELAEGDLPNERGPAGKFASIFTDLLVGGKEEPGLVKNADPIIRQVAFNALGKITPKPAAVFAAGKNHPFENALEGQVGPSRLAIYALSDLIKNAHFLEFSDELKTYLGAVRAADFALRKPGEDELVRGYAFQAIEASARIFTDYPVSPGTAIHIDGQDVKTLNPNVAAIMKAYQESGPRILVALRTDPSHNIRLTALEALTQIVSARMKIMEKFYDAQKELPADKRAKRDDLFAAFKSPDPIRFLFEIDTSDSAGPRWNWETVPALLKKDQSVRVRRGAIAFLEMVGEDVEIAIETGKLERNAKVEMRRRFAQWITPGLRDRDFIVRWTAARAVRHVTLDMIDGDTIEGLGEMLIEPTEHDPDPAAAALVTLQVVAKSPQAGRSIRYLKSVIADREKDVEVRQAAISTLVIIGGPDANAAIPELASVLSDGDVRIRRAAAEAIGQLARPATREIADSTLIALREALRDEDPTVRQNVSEAILSLTPPRPR